MLVQSESHPIHPQSLECPRCGKHTVVLQGESHLVCVSCGWWFDTAQTWNFSPILRLLLLVLVLILVL